VTKPFQVRVSEEWLTHLDATIRELPSPADGTALSRSTFVREVVEMENLLWRRSPYVCKNSRNFVLITQVGDVLFHRIEELQLTADLREIPAHLEVRYGKRRWIAEKKADPWGLNAFALRRGSQVDVLTGEGTDVASKTVQFKGPFPEGSRVTREGCFLFEDYVQRREERGESLESLYDRTEFEIDIPTRHLEILVVLDLGLYDDYPDSEGKPALRFDVRNRDGVAFSGPDALGRFLQQNNLVRIGNQYPTDSDVDELYDETVEKVKAHHGLLLESLEMFRERSPKKPDFRAQVERARSLVELPKRYLFYRVAWTGADIGLICSVRFPRPFESRGSLEHEG